MLITCDTDLRKYLPNALATVEGESSLYDKLDFSWLRLKDGWQSISQARLCLSKSLLWSLPHLFACLPAR